MAKQLLHYVQAGVEHGLLMFLFHPTSTTFQLAAAGVTAALWSAIRWPFGRKKPTAEGQVVVGPGATKIVVGGITITVARKRRPSRRRERVGRPNRRNRA